MQQDLIPIHNKVTGITSRTIVITVPFLSDIPNGAPIHCEVHGRGFVNVTGTIWSFYFIIPIIYYSNNGIFQCVPDDLTPYDESSSVFTHLYLPDNAATTAFEIYYEVTTNGLEFSVTPPSTGTWEIGAFVKTFKRLQ